MNLFRIASIASFGLIMAISVPAQEVSAVVALPTLDEASALPDADKLELAAQTLLGDVRLPDYGFPLLVEMSARGNREAVRLLARGITNNDYSFGEDIEVVLRALGNEAMLGSSSAIVAWATIHDRGVDVTEDDVRAYEWYRWAAIVGSESGRRLTAIALASGKGVERNVDEAVQWADRLPATRRSSAYLAIADILYASQQAGDAELADRLTIDSATLEPANAMRAALQLREFSGSPSAQAEAAMIIADAASAGDDRALVTQANLDHQSNDPEMRARAVQAYIDLANSDNVEAIKQLARLISGGSLSTQKLEEAMAILTRQADAGNMEAITAISQAYMFGTGVAVSFEKAATYFRMGADLGDADAQYQLGMMYAGGIGVARDVELAKSWLQKSALGGSQIAAATLGAMN